VLPCAMPVTGFFCCEIAIVIFFFAVLWRVAFSLLTDSTYATSAFCRASMLGHFFFSTCVFRSYTLGAPCLLLLLFFSTAVASIS
jgi:hypothetical protein